MEIISAVVKGVLIGLFMAISVGPTLFAVIKYSMSNNYKAGLAFVIGVSVSDIMYVTIANVAAAWLVVLNSYGRYIAYGGAAILVTVGLVGLLKKADDDKAQEVKTISGRHYFRIWVSGFLINSINPGVIISWLAAVSATMNKGGGYRFVLFGTCLSLILAIDFLKVFLAEKIRVLLTPQRLGLLHRVSSFIILLLGLILFVKTILE